jgi:hypothetical protein
MTMKHFLRTYLTIAAVLLFALAGCNNSLDLPEQDAGGNGIGNVLISIGGGTGGAARTLSPDDTAMSGFTYQLTFSGNGTTHAPETVTFGQTKTVNLAPGNWTITAQAKSGDSVKAEGSWTGAVSADTTTVSITLAPKTGGGNGTFAYRVTFPDLGAGGSKSLTMYAVTEGGNETPAPETPVTYFTSGSDCTLSLPAGLYRLNLSLTDSTGKTAARTEAVHIYAGLTTTGTFNFWLEDFISLADLDIFAVDISQETDWNYMVVGKDGSSLFLDVDESTGIPTLAYLKPEKDSDSGFTYLFKENGLPDKIIANGYVLYFGNFSGYKFDMAIIYPDDTIEYHYDIETDINWDAYGEISPERSILRRSFWGDLWNVIKKDPIGNVLGGVTCIAQFWVPPLASGCATYIASTVGKVVIEIVPVDGFTKNVANAIIDLAGCAAIDPSGKLLDIASAANSCLSLLTGTIDVLTNVDLSVVNQKIEQINETIRKIDGDALTTTIPADLLEKLLLLGIEVNNGNNPPNIEGTYLISPSVLVRSNFSDSYSPGYRFIDMQLTFSDQNNAKMTVDVNSIEGSVSNANGINSFITGTATKFSIFSIMNDTMDNSQFVRIYSGEITSSGIKNVYGALICTVEGPNTIRRGQGRLHYDSDGFSEKVQGGGRRVIIDMYDSAKASAQR